MCDEYECASNLRDAFMANMTEYIRSNHDDKKRDYLKNMLILTFTEMLEVDCFCIEAWMDTLINNHVFDLLSDSDSCSV